ncbi:serine hydrolase domain-containing protein [Lentiprolixibacter aurantiacus]|uniref:Serine hydrolase n=1 Tax=Lentiprolixibacter aurantiacus TaxID=2993939 RepID=A0AAE3MIL0_9FLAO|nr:serine hydrolase [Lentiprolixibacter aurantiacus]MCX2718099.1 serine hydrolase [Lentiprolixibacter aurantiacus]
MKILIKKKSVLFMFLLFIGGTGLTAQSNTKINTENLEKLIQFSKETYTDEIMLVHHGKVISNWKNSECESIHFNTASMVKSWTGLVVGILIDKGFIESEDEAVCKYIPEWEAGCQNQVTIKNLLTMSSGLRKRRGAEGILAKDTIKDYIMNLRLDTSPNEGFQYSNESVQLLGSIIENVTGKSASKVFREYLFRPLGMDSTSLYKAASGEDVVYGGARTTVDDAVKIGLLMLNGGRYNNKQIISEEWVKKSTTPSEKAPYYGYLWWLDNNSEDKNYAATGDLGKLTIVFPDLNLVFVRRQSCNQDISGNMPWMGPDYLKLIASVLKP